MIKIENPKYKSALLTILFYVILWFLNVFRYEIIPSGMLWFTLETVAPIILPLLSLVFFVINIWKYYNKAKTNIFSILIHAIVILSYLFLLYKFLG